MCSLKGVENMLQEQLELENACALTNTLEIKDGIVAFLTSFKKMHEHFVEESEHVFRRSCRLTS